MSQEHPRPRRTGRLETRPDAQHLVLERSFRAPIQDVWAAVTDPDRLARWIGTWTGDPSSGAVVFEMTAESAPPQPCRITVCEPPTRLGLELLEPDGAAPWTLTVVLTAHGGTTTLTFDQALGPSAPVRDVGPGWEYYLDRLVAAETGGDVAAITWDAYVPMGEEYLDS